MLSNLKAHYSQFTTHSSLLIVAPVPRPSDGIKGMLLIPRVKEPAAIRPSDATPSERRVIMNMRLEDAKLNSRGLSSPWKQ